MFIKSRAYYLLVIFRRIKFITVLFILIFCNNFTKPVLYSSIDKMSYPLTEHIKKDKQYYKFCLYGFLKNLRFFDPFLILFFLSKNLTFLEVGVLYAFREIAINIFEIPSGIVADAFGRRKTLAFSFLVYIIAFIIFYFSSDFALFLGAMLMYALGDAIRTGINKAMIIEYLKRTDQLKFKVGYYGHTRSWSQIGSAISSLIGGFLVFYHQELDIIFLFSIVPYLLDFLNVLSYPKYLDEGIKHVSHSSDKLRFAISTFWNVIRSKELFKTLVNVSVYSGYYKSIKDFIQPFLKLLIIQLPIFLVLSEEQKVGLFLGFIYFLIFLNNSFASRKAAEISNHFSSQGSFQNVSLFIGVSIGLVSGLMMEYLPSVFVIIFFIMVLFIENARKPSGVALITEKSNEMINASIISVSSQLASLFGGLFVIVIGFVADIFGVGIAISFMSFIILILFPIFKIKK